MRRWLPAACFFVIVSSGVSACCHANRLTENKTTIRRVSFSVSVVEPPTVHFTQESLRIRRTPGASQSYSETSFAELLAAMGPVALASSLTEQAPAAFQTTLGWSRHDDEQTADATLSLRVENYLFRARDGLSEAEVLWQFEARLVKASTNELLWRDCLEWSSGRLGMSMTELARGDLDARSELLDRLAKGLLQRLAERIAGARS